MTTERRCDLCKERLTNEYATYDLDGRYRFKLVVAERVKWWRGRKETHDLDVCRDCVNALGQKVLAVVERKETS